MGERENYKFMNPFNVAYIVAMKNQVFALKLAENCPP